MAANEFGADTVLGECLQQLRYSFSRLVDAAKIDQCHRRSPVSACQERQRHDGPLRPNQGLLRPTKISIGQGESSLAKSPNRSRGLNRSARVKGSIAAAGLPAMHWIHPLCMSAR